MRPLARLLKWIATDIWSGLALLACLVPVLALVVRFGLPDLSGASGVDLLLEVPLMFVSYAFALLFCACPQIVMAFAVASVEAPAAKATGAILSLALATWYAIWALGADLTGNSTAPVALLFYPTMAQGWAWLGAFALVALATRLSAD